MGVTYSAIAQYANYCQSSAVTANESACLQTKYEQIIADLEEKLRKEQEARKELEKLRRRHEQEISDLKDQLAEKSLQIDDLQAALAKRDDELQAALSTGDEQTQHKVCSLSISLLPTT